MYIERIRDLTHSLKGYNVLHCVSGKFMWKYVVILREISGIPVKSSVGFLLFVASKFPIYTTYSFTEALKK